MTNKFNKLCDNAGETIGYYLNNNCLMRKDAFKEYVFNFDRNCAEWMVLRQMCKFDEKWVALNYDDPSGLQYSFVKTF